MHQITISTIHVYDRNQNKSMLPCNRTQGQTFPRHAVAIIYISTKPAFKLGYEWIIASNEDYGLWLHDDVIKWRYFPRYWPFVRGINRSPVNSPHKGQWRGASMFSLICVWINGRINNGEAGDFRRHRPHYDVIVMVIYTLISDNLC